MWHLQHPSHSALQNLFTMYIYYNLGRTEAYDKEQFWRLKKWTWLWIFLHLACIKCVNHWWQAILAVIHYHVFLMAWAFLNTCFSCLSRSLLSHPEVYEKLLWLWFTKFWSAEIWVRWPRGNIPDNFTAGNFWKQCSFVISSHNTASLYSTEVSFTIPLVPSDSVVRFQLCYFILFICKVLLNNSSMTSHLRKYL